MKLISLHYQSGSEYHLNPGTFTGVEFMPAEKQTRIDVIGQYGAYKCVETPEEIQALIDQSNATPPPASVRGVGAQGPVFGDGAKMEARGDGELDDGWRGKRGPGDPGGGLVGEYQGVLGVRLTSDRGNEK